MSETRRAPTHLYDIRAFAFKKHNPVNGRYVGTVHTKPADLAGHIADGALVKPDIAATRAALPYQWRKAFDNVRGRELATLYATLRAIV